MPYQGSNAEWLQKLSMYDLLMLLNERHCIMGTLCELPNQRCTEYDGRCEECIADWLGDKHGGNEWNT